MRVSILARPEERALHAGRWPAVAGRWCFNPRPSRRTGATSHLSGYSPATTRFNPRPSRRTGATAPSVGHSCRLACFNPRPSRRTGATATLESTGQTYAVSILARPEERALLRSATGTLFIAGKFQSSPVPKNGRYRRPSVFTGRLGAFQSSPVPKNGRYDAAPDGLYQQRGFNPRPSRRTGATQVGSQCWRKSQVSILARPEERALPDRAAGIVRGTGVSILARPEERALRAGTLTPPPKMQFQSSPVPKNGRYVFVAQLAHVVLRVSILARPEERALPVIKAAARRVLKFQSSPVPKNGRYVSHES